MMQFIISISSQPFIKTQKNTFDFTPDKDNIVRMMYWEQGTLIRHSSAPQSFPKLFLDYFCNHKITKCFFLLSWGKSKQN